MLLVLIYSFISLNPLKQLWPVGNMTASAKQSKSSAADTV